MHGIILNSDHGFVHDTVICVRVNELHVRREGRVERQGGKKEGRQAAAAAAALDLQAGQDESNTSRHCRCFPEL